MVDLESRLSGIDKNSLLAAIQHPSSAYDKLYVRAEFTEKFHDYCTRRNITFADGTQAHDAGRRIEGQFHKKVLEPVFYGMLHANRVPSSAISRLTAWEAAYFFAGMDTLDPKYNRVPDFANEEPDKIVARLILRGFDALQRRHADARMHAPKHLHGEKIDSELVLTGETPIRSQCYAILNRPVKKSILQGELFAGMATCTPVAPAGNVLRIQRASPDYCPH